MTDETKSGAGSLLVRATINLAGVRLGEVVEADPESDYVQRCLASGFLIPVSRPETGAG